MKDTRTPQGVMFIQTTPNSKLKKELQAMDSQMRFANKCKYVEVGGESILSVLFSPDPWRTPCGRSECVLCKTEPGKCATRSVIYKYDCVICQEAESPCSYIGETARTAFERSQEHEKMMRNMDNESPMVEHQVEKHPGLPINMSMKVIRKVQRTLDRKVLEGNLIAENDVGTLMNRKGEWGQNLPQSLV